jgi:hypothetical protein
MKKQELKKQKEFTWEVGHNCQSCGVNKTYCANMGDVVVIFPFCNDCTKILTDIIKTRKKEIDKELSKRIIAVITDNKRSFEKWVFENKIETSTLMLVFHNKAFDKNITYIGIYDIQQLCSMAFDSFIETENAKDNPQYEQIIKVIKGNINKKPCS